MAWTRVSGFHMMDLLRVARGAGRTILVSSHILEEVERVAERVLVVVAGRLAASGDFREIRRLMTDRPHAFDLRTSDDRALAAAIVARPTVAGVALENDRLVVRAADYAAFTGELAGIARAQGISIYELIPADESLSSPCSPTWCARERVAGAACRRRCARASASPVTPARSIPPRWGRSGALTARACSGGDARWASCSWLPCRSSWR